MRKMKQGISLIVLVITIIVMIVLAGSIIISLSNSGIIGRANETVEASNLKEVQNLATLIWAEAYIDGVENLDAAYVKSKLEEQGIDADNYKITVTENGISVTAKIPVPESWKASVREVTEDGVPIPIGFVKSPYPNEGEKDKGLVIYALTETEITQGKTTITDSHDTALKGRNQFVWVPVPQNEFETKFVRDNFGIKDDQGNDKYPLSTTLGTDYWEIVLTTNNMPSNNANKLTDYVSAATLLEATKMYESVKKYGGFYIARYEVGSKEVANLTYNYDEHGYIATRATKDNISNLSIAMGKYPYGAVAWGTLMSDETKSDGAVSIARAFYPSTGTTYGVVSTLTYGVQWDRTLAWWKELNSNFNLTNSTSYGVYKDTTIVSTDLNENAKYSIYANGKYRTWENITEKGSSGDWLLTTGAYKKANVYNIYDMAGNLYEWTMEGLSIYYRINRGGYFGQRWW